MILVDLFALLFKIIERYKISPHLFQCITALCLDKWSCISFWGHGVNELVNAHIHQAKLRWCWRYATLNNL